MAEYIEKKKLVNSLKMWLMDLENDMDKGDYGELCENKGAREAVESCICEAEEQPAADVQPVRRGKWIITDDVEHFIAVCSECGRTEDSRDIKDMPYCHCGARMDQEG